MFNIILFGPPGAGKGTQAKKLSSEFGFVHISSGVILRETIKKGNKAGKIAKKFIDQGYLVPDEIVMKELLRESLKYENKAKGIIFDGFPRNLHQAEIFNKMLKKKGESISLVISLEVDHQELFKRIIGRASDSGRTDDNEQVIKRRFVTYELETFPLKEYYRNKSRLVEVSGMAPTDEVYSIISDEVKKRLKTLKVDKR